MRIIAIFLMSAIIGFAQTREPVQQMFEVQGRNIYLPDTLSQFKLDKFTIGWMWGGSMKST
jgi:hypothetical protein